MSEEALTPIEIEELLARAVKAADSEEAWDLCVNADGALHAHMPYLEPAVALVNAVPNLVATIEAQRQEIERLNAYTDEEIATIEATLPNPEDCGSWSGWDLIVRRLIVTLRERDLNHQK